MTQEPPETEVVTEGVSSAPPGSSPEAGVAVTVLRANRPADLGVGELWRHRELVYFLAWRDVKVRYKQTALGAGWALLQPALAIAVFSVIFGRLVRVPSDGLPYPLFALAALLPWQLFATTLTKASASVVNQQNLVQKVYFPRLALPVSTAVVALVDFVVAFTLLAALMLAYGSPLRLTALAVPALVALATVTALAAGIWLSALCVHFRDVGHLVPFLVQGWFFLTPVVYPLSLVPAPWRPVLALNPMVGVVEGFRWALLAAPPPAPLTLAVSTITVVVLLVTGLSFFRRVEETLADFV